jgi:2-polyprenyl-3-methyl-5-hydroxy-6-metoxy-1,4-benzoquinol methylase
MNCRVCGNNDMTYFYSQGSNDQFKFYRCNTCSLVNLDLSGIKIEDNQHKYVEVFNPPADYEKEKESSRAYQFVSKIVPAKGSMLDIGCGKGSLLYFFKKGGWDVHGLELSEVFARHVREKLNVEVEVCNFLEYDHLEEHYDLVSLRHVLEHIPESVITLKKIASLLVPGGYGYFEFPNIDGLSHKIQRLKNKYHIGGKKYSRKFVPGHCNEFSKQSFEYLLSLTGFKLIRWETYSKKSLSNFLYNHIHIGTKARALVKKV